MKRPALALSALIAASPACAGEARCWYENGVVVVSAQVAGVTGDFILDTATPMTQLAETQAQGAGIESSVTTGDVRFAGRTFRDRAVLVADLDVRTGLLPTPIAGVIGADVLEGQVLDLSLQPCRIGLWRPADAPAFAATQRLPLVRAGGLWTVPARVSDGATRRKVQLVPATGSDAPLRLVDGVASAPAGDKPQELYPYGVRRPRLRSLRLAGREVRETPGGLLKADAAAGDGWLGTPLLEGFKVRLDYARGRLSLAPQRKRPRREPGP